LFTDPTGNEKSDIHASENELQNIEGMTTRIGRPFALPDSSSASVFPHAVSFGYKSNLMKNEPSQLNDNFANAVQAYWRNKGQVDSAFNKQPVVAGLSTALLLGLSNAYPEYMGEIQDMQTALVGDVEKQANKYIDKVPGISDVNVNIPQKTIDFNVRGYPFKTSVPKKTISTSIPGKNLDLSFSIWNGQDTPGRMSRVSNTDDYVRQSNTKDYVQQFLKTLKEPAPSETGVRIKITYPSQYLSHQ
jgi:hypothetical protein